MLYPNGQILHNLYKDGEALPGVVKVSMPDIVYKKVNCEGAAMMGTAEIPLAGMIDAMTVNMEFSSYDAMIELGTNEWHDVALYQAEQYFDGVNRTEELRELRFELSIRPLSNGMGDVQAFTAHNNKGSFSVCKYAVYSDDEEIIYIDQFACIHRVNGVDNAAKVRKAIGMT